MLAGTSLLEIRKAPAQPVTPSPRLLEKRGLGGFLVVGVPGDPGQVPSAAGLYLLICSSPQPFIKSLMTL